jgi:spermidine/putrescine transport system substrate-binding protein
MFTKRFLALVAGVFAFSTTQSHAAGELNIFNWGNYTSPELIKKFEDTYDVKVTITDYDSNDTALAKIRAGAHGFDMAVPSASYMPIWISEGLLLETNPSQMSNYGNVRDQFKSPEWDPGHRYSVPYQWGTVGVIVDTSLYNGDINSWSMVFDPPEALSGKINVAPEMKDLIDAALKYTGGDPCTNDKGALKKARDVLIKAKPHWLSMDYGVIEKFAGRDLGASLYWNGAAFRAREKNTDVRFGYPREGYPMWMDAVVVLKDAKNVENAKLFQNFLMEPENAALASAFARYANGIKGSEPFMPEDMKGAPEVEIAAEHVPNGFFSKTCSPEVTEMYSAIWTELQK